LRDLAVANDQGRVGRDLAPRAVGDVRPTQHDYRWILLSTGASGHEHQRKGRQEASFHGCFLFF
jgi:hypothetical protein